MDAKIYFQIEFTNLKDENYYFICNTKPQIIKNNLLNLLFRF